MVHSDERRSLVLLPRVAAGSARHRMALWRELRRSRAVLLGRRAWGGAAGTLLVRSASGHTGRDGARLDQLYTEAREAEWSEFRADCGKYLAELDKEERMGKYTLAELEEEEQSLDRLRRWYRELRSRNLLGVPASTDSASDRKRCGERIQVYAERVYATLGDPGA